MWYKINIDVSTLNVEIPLIILLRRSSTRKTTYIMKKYYVVQKWDALLKLIRTCLGDHNGYFFIWMLSIWDKIEHEWHVQMNISEKGLDGVLI